jgi:hypothetical protein
MQRTVHYLNSETADLFDDIRAGYRFVAERAKHVRICDERLKEYALALPHHAPDNTLDTDHHYMTDDPENLAAAVLILDAVNFGSGYTDTLVAEGWNLLDNSIYFTVSTALKQRFEKYGVFTARQLRDLTAADFMMLLDLPRYGETAEQVAGLYTPSVNELGAYIDEEFDGRFTGLLEASEGSAAKFITQLGALSGFHDVHVYQGRDIPIYKRAQHVAASLNGFFTRIGRPLFGDIDSLTIFPDNAIPHVLRTDGLLEYTPDLAGRIDAGVFIPSGSEEEIELRCCAGEAMERMAAIKGLKAVEMDYTLWHRSVEDPRYQQGRAHRTATRFY